MEVVRRQSQITSLHGEKASGISWKGNTEGMSSSGCFWSAFLVTSWHRWPRSWWQEMQWWTLFLQKKNWPGLWRLRAALATETISSRMEFRIRRWGIKAKSRITSFDCKRENLVCSGTCLEECRGRQPWRKKESRRAGWFSRITSAKLKNCLTPCAGGWQEGCLDEQVAPK